MDKRALILDGATDVGPDTGAAGNVAADVLRREGWSVERIALAEVDIAPCRGCFGCWVVTPGVCVIDDAGRDVARRMVQCDLSVHLTPVTFGGYSSELKKAIDRSIPNLSPYFRRVEREVHHAKRYARYPRLLGIGVCRRAPVDPDDEELFETLIRRNAINFHAPSHGACVVPATEDDERLERAIGRAVRTVTGS